MDNLKIKYLSLEYHSVCNMRCVYCDDKYYGGLKENYNVLCLLNAIKEINEGMSEAILASTLGHSSIQIEPFLSTLPIA